MKLYEPLQKKYSLPSWEELDASFDLGHVEDEDFSLKLLRKRINDKIQFILHTLDPILHPDVVSYAELCECRALTDKEKEQLITIYKQLIMLDRDLLIAALHSTEQKDALLIKKACTLYKEVIPALIPFIEKIRDSWNGTTEQEEKAGYLG